MNIMYKLDMSIYNFNMPGHNLTHCAQMTVRIHPVFGMRYNIFRNDFRRRQAATLILRATLHANYTIFLFVFFCIT